MPLAFATLTPQCSRTPSPGDHPKSHHPQRRPHGRLSCPPFGMPSCISSTATPSASPPAVIRGPGTARASTFPPPLSLTTLPTLCPHTSVISAPLILCPHITSYSQGLRPLTTLPLPSQRRGRQRSSLLASSPPSYPQWEAPLRQTGLMLAGLRHSPPSPLMDFLKSCHRTLRCFATPRSQKQPIMVCRRHLSLAPKPCLTAFASPNGSTPCTRSSFG